MNIQKTLRIVSLLLLLLGLSSAVDAQRRGNQWRWVKLGQVSVNGQSDHDRISLNRRDSFRALQLGVKGGAIEFQRVVVHFENGADQELEVRDHINSGGKTRVIDLQGERRKISSIDFWYGKANWRSRPIVNIWGSH
jgi:hypothetical protein